MVVTKIVKISLLKLLVMRTINRINTEYNYGTKILKVKMRQILKIHLNKNLKV